MIITTKEFEYDNEGRIKKETVTEKKVDDTKPIQYVPYVPYAPVRPWWSVAQPYWWYNPTVTTIDNTIATTTTNVKL
jgi:hypothetical protein